MVHGWSSARSRMAGIVAVALLVLQAAPTNAKSFVTFESGQVRPLALSPDGRRLYSVNTPDSRLEIFDSSGPELKHLFSIPVGLEPVAVALRTPDEAWVVNHLSDSVSIVDLSTRRAPRVVRTLLVGDEPRDIVFSGKNNSRAFITTARRGQHFTHPSLVGVPGAGDPRLTTPGEPRASVWVFDARNPGKGLGGTPLEIVHLFSDVPRALAATPDGSTVYAAAFASGNQTTTVSTGTVCPGFDPSTPCILLGGVEYPGGNAGPATNFQGVPAPDVGIVVKFNEKSGHFEDELGRNWDNAVRFDLPDLDVFEIDTDTLETKNAYSGVGTTLFNMSVNPQNGSLYVSNTESFNHVRFEGPGEFGGSTVQGHLAEARITVIDDGNVLPRHLNKHIDYDLRPAPPETKQHSLATPLDMVVSSDGQTLHVAAFGSGKVGVFDINSLEDDTFDPTHDSANYIDVSGGGPSGLALDETKGRLYVFTRFDNAISVVDLATAQETAHLPLHNPEPAQVVEGRPLLYDAVATSSNGEASCASCHIFGDKDELAWDLGNPDASVTVNPGAAVGNIRLAALAPLVLPRINGSGHIEDFHPMKGPMTTQTLRGLANHGAMHWRGDRAVGFFGTDNTIEPPFDADLAFRNFIPAFEDLNGRDGPISETEMQKFADFALQITLPPNPVRALDNSLTPEEARGRAFFFGCAGADSVTGMDSVCSDDEPVNGGGHRSDGIPIAPELGFSCEGCHTLDPANGFFGTDGRWSVEGLPQIVKIPHLRNLYTKVGMFGSPIIPGLIPGDNEHQGDQIRGFGFLHNGSTDTIFRFFRGLVFQCSEDGLVGFCGGDQQRRDTEAFMLAFDSDLPPIVGQQLTLNRRNIRRHDARDRLALMEERCRTPFESKILGPRAKECDLIAHLALGKRTVGLQLVGHRLYRSDRGIFVWGWLLRAIAALPGREVTFTAVPYGSGRRMSRDRDEDGRSNIHDSCPADPTCR